MKPHQKNIKPAKPANKPAAPQKQVKQPVKSSLDKWWRDKTFILLLVFVLAATFFVMSPALKAGFVNWDDDVNVYDNPNVTTFNVSKIFSSNVIGNYNPLATLSFAMEYHYFKDAPFSYHLHNILLHILNTFLVFLLMMLLRMRKYWALLVAFLFGVHPLHVESVAWVTERKDVLFAFFYLLSAICYLYHFNTKKKRFLLLTYLFFILSLFSKIQAVSLPLTLLLFDYLLGRPLKIKLLVEKIPYFVFSLAVGLVGIYFLQQQESLDPNKFTIIERLLIGTYSLCIYLLKSIVPYEMSTLYPYPKPGAFPWYYYCTPFALILLGYLVYRSGKVTREVIFGTLFFLFNIVFLIQVVSAGQGFIADRFSYISYIGLFYVFAYGLKTLYDKRKKLQMVIVSFIVIVSLMYSRLAWGHTPVWENTDTLFTYVLEHYKNVATAFRNRGNYYRDNKLYDKALPDYTRLIELEPANAKAYDSRANIYFKKGENNKALTDYNEAIKLNPANVDAYSNRGAIYAMLNNFDLSIKDLSKAIELNPKHKDALKNRAVTYYTFKHYDKAKNDLDAYIPLVPADAGIFNLRGLCEMQTNDFGGALKDYTEAIKIDPKGGIFYQNRSLLYQLSGYKAKALEDITKAQQFGVKISQAYLDKLK